MEDYLRTTCVFIHAFILFQAELIQHFIKEQGWIKLSYYHEYDFLKGICSL